MTKRLIVVDVSNYIFRAFFAIRSLNAPDGTPVNAVYGVFNMFLKLFHDYQPTHVLLARDTAGGSFRNEIYPLYKANRGEPPEELVPQFGLIDKLIELMNVASISDQNYEADDIIGSVVTQFKDDFDEILIASGDKDLMQFVGGPIKILDTMKDKIYGRNEVFEKMGVYPNQIVDYLSLVGDSSDNIPGVKGIGAKGAAKMLAEFTTLEDCIANKEKFKGKKICNALTDHEEMAHLSKKLITIVTDMKLPLALDDFKYNFSASSELIDFLQKLGFKSLLKKLPSAELQKNSGEPNNDFSFQVLENKASVQTMLGSCRQHQEIFVHIDWLEMGHSALPKSLSFCTEDGRSFNIHEGRVELHQVLKQILAFKATIVTCQSKQLYKFAFSQNAEMACNIFDIEQAYFNLKPSSKNDLLSIVQDFTGEIVGILNLNDFGDLTFDENLYRKNHCFLAFSSRVVFPQLKEKIQEFEVESAVYEIDFPVISILANMEMNGVILNRKFYQELDDKFSKKLSAIEKEIEQISKENINLKSPKQVGALLFEKLSLPIIKKTKTGYSTDSAVLAELVQITDSEVPALILQYRELDKLLSTYIKTMPGMIDSDTQRIHTRFKMNNAATGRLSSDHPNLQNIPVRTENGRLLRKGFEAKPGAVLFACDYSQVELRILADMSGDPTMINAFKNDKDIHAETAAQIFGIPLDKVNKEQRNRAKAINFGLMYGQSSFGLSQTLGISRSEASDFINEYFQKFSHVKIFLDQLKEQAESTGYAETRYGRKRLLADINSSNRTLKAMADRIAINSPIQGTAADIIKLAMIHISKALKENNLTSQMILQVHDELIFEVPENEISQLQDLVIDKMENVVELKVPLKVDYGIGKNWFDIK